MSQQRLLKALGVSALSVCLGQTPPCPEPDSSPQREQVVLAVTAEALRFIACTEPKSDPEGPEIPHAKTSALSKTDFPFWRCRDNGDGADLGVRRAWLPLSPREVGEQLTSGSAGL